MDKLRFQNKHQRVIGFEGGALYVERLHSDYTLSLFLDYPESQSSETGLLSVLEINPQQKASPQFIVRWDRNEETLDVDAYIDGVRQDNKIWWKENKYDGHHPQKVRERVFWIDITESKDIIFRGEIRVGKIVKRDFSERSAEVTGKEPD